jgi:hypothetical protein
LQCLAVFILRIAVSSEMSNEVGWQISKQEQ